MGFIYPNPIPMVVLHGYVRGEVLRDISDTHSPKSISMSNLEGKKALITHSGDGLGFAIAIALAQQQAELIVHETSPAVAGVAVERLKLAIPGIKVSAIAADLATESGRQRLLESAGKIDIFVSDGVGQGATDFAQSSDITIADSLTVSSGDSEALANRLAQAMSVQAWGRIFLLTSTVSQRVTASTEKREHAPELLPYVTDNQALNSGIKAFRLPIARLILEPVADVMKSEVMRTTGSLKEVADQMERDHRPIAIQRAARDIASLTRLITDACLA